MGSNGGLPRAILPSLVLLTIGVVLIGIAFVLEQTPAHEWSLTIGAPSILIVVGGLIWLAIVLIWHFVSRGTDRRRGRS